MTGDQQSTVDNEQNNSGRDKLQTLHVPELNQNGANVERFATTNDNYKKPPAIYSPPDG